MILDYDYIKKVPTNIPKPISEENFSVKGAGEKLKIL
jgi:hypothetical protein